VKTRVLKVNLGKALQAAVDKLGSKVRLAARIGISTPTLTAMINDDWDFIARDAIERTADYLQLESTAVF
jgi:hypothetical protein